MIKRNRDTRCARTDSIGRGKLPRHPLLAKQAEVVSHAGAVARELISKKGMVESCKSF